jgi:hypothetical protein
MPYRPVAVRLGSPSRALAVVRGASLAVMARTLACLALTATGWRPHSAAAQNPLEGCYIETYDDRGIAIYNCDAQKRRPPPPPPLPDVWGAIAVSSTTLMSGTSWNYRSEAAASQRALTECRATRASDCRVVVTVADVCVSLAISKPEKVYAVGGPIGAANFSDGNAMLRCQRAGGRACTISTSFCADGIRHVVRDQTIIPYGRRQ